MQDREGQRRTFSALMTILVVLAILVVAPLAFMLVQFMRMHPPPERYVARTRTFLNRIQAALESYKDHMGCYPPDTIPPGTGLLRFKDGSSWTLPEPASPPEALHYYLANPKLSAEHPHLDLEQVAVPPDLNKNGLPELTDDWGNPLLYNRPRFPSGGFDDGTDPFHNAASFDLYSVGPDGQTGTGRLRDPWTDLAGFCKKAMDEPADGSGEDDIPNW